MDNLSINDKMNGVTERVPTVQVNEVFGPTIQGEGPDIGRPCMFLRLHNCPVNCPGCDTAYTWDGSEKGKVMTIEALRGWFADAQLESPGVGLVVSGGEPLIHYRNQAFADFIRWAAERTWVSMETSGFVGDKLVTAQARFANFLYAFTRISLSPKITPCLHGAGWSDAQLSTNMDLIFESLLTDPARPAKGPNNLILKFVVRDEEDFNAVCKFMKQYVTGYPSRQQVPVYLMPYGLEAEEIIKSCNDLMPFLNQTGWILAPRLHALLWGKKRGV